MLFGKKDKKKESVEDLLEQLRKKFRNAAEEHGEKYFHPQELESRIRYMQANKIPFDTFLAQEAEYFTKVKKLLQDRKEKQERVKAANETIDQIIDNNYERISHYPEIFFHPASSREMRHLVGAINQILPLSEELCSSYPESREIVRELERYSASENKPSVFLRHYAEQAAILPRLEADRFEQRTMQNAAVQLAGIRRQCELLKKEKRIEVEKAGSLMAKVDKILEDFRLTSLAFQALRKGKMK